MIYEDALMHCGIDLPEIIDSAQMMDFAIAVLGYAADEALDAAERSAAVRDDSAMQKLHALREKFIGEINAIKDVQHQLKNDRAAERMSSMLAANDREITPTMWSHTS